MPRVRSIIVCEDVRREVNYKEIIIGVYSSGIKFSKPAPGKLRQLWFRVDAELDKKGVFKFQLVSPSGAPVIDSKIDIEIDAPGKAILNITDADRSFYEEGIYEIRCGFDGQEPTICDTLEITFGREP